MSKLQLIMAIVRLIQSILIDSDGDGRIDLADSDPNDPSVK